MSKNKKAVGVLTTQTAYEMESHRNHSPQQLVVSIGGDEPRVDSRVLAKHLGASHKSVFELIRLYLADFAELGKVPVQTEALASGQSEKFASLNEDQCYLALTYKRNTPRIRELKVRLVKTFRQARKAAELRQVEYKPGYHELHDAIDAKAAQSHNAKFVHMNFNKLCNRAAGIAAGQRATASLPAQSMLIVVQAIATSAVQAAPDHHLGYQRAKAALQALSSAVAIEGPGA